MAGFERTGRRSAASNPRAITSLPAGIAEWPTEEEVSICDAVLRRIPEIDPRSLLECLRKEARSRKGRVEALRELVASGEYQVSPRAVAASILLEGDLMLH